MDSKTSKMSAPVAVLMFNRPDLTEKTLARIADSRPSALYLIADGPRPDVPEDAPLCSEVREIAQSMDWDCPVYCNFADTNMGLRERVISGLDWVFDSEERAIVVEDDCFADNSFFPFCTELLDRFTADPRIGIISGNNFLAGKKVSDDSYFFSSDVRIWGWATWARVWKDFRANGAERVWSRSEAREISSRLDAPNRRRSLRRMAQISHTLDTWDVAFVLHCLSKGYLNVVPRVNLVSNVGFGERSTHTKFESFTAEVSNSSIDFPLSHPKELQTNREAGRIEANQSLLKWVWFPLMRPIDFLGRLGRYVKVMAGIRSS